MTQPTENQSPPAVDPIMAKMRHQEYGNTNIGTILLMAGIGVTLVLLLVVTVLVCLLLLAVFGGTGIGYWGWFIVMALLLVPYVIFLEKRTHGRYWADSTQSAGVDWSSPGRHDLERTSTNAARYLDALLIGPRMLVGGYQRVRGIEAREFELFLARCAAFVRDLGAMGGAAPIVKLAKPGETPAVVDTVMTHLDKRDWIGHSSDRQRVWLSTPAKNDLIKWGEFQET